MGGSTMVISNNHKNVVKSIELDTVAFGIISDNQGLQSDPGASVRPAKHNVGWICLIRGSRDYHIASKIIAGIASNVGGHQEEVYRIGGR